jgi:predicted dehydrogenase
MISVVVIGVGNIAQGYDTPESPHILTHIKAYKTHPDCKVIGVFDIDQAKAKSVALRWDIQHVLASFEEIGQIKPDIVSICTPDYTHSEYAEALLQFEGYMPKVVFCEKPIDTDTNRSMRVLERYAKANVPFIVNYSRRFLPKLHSALQRGFQNAGRVLSIRIKYYGGLKHNASHLLDVILQHVDLSVISGSAIQILDESEHDATISGMWRVRIHSESGESYDSILTLEGYAKSVIQPLEIEFVCENLSMVLQEKQQCVLNTFIKQEHPLYPGFFTFEESNDFPTVEVMVNHAIMNATQEIVAIISNSRQGQIIKKQKNSVDTALIRCLRDVENNCIS